MIGFSFGFAPLSDYREKKTSQLIEVSGLVDKKLQVV
jgi:hypothetical protein